MRIMHQSSEMSGGAVLKQTQMHVTPFGYQRHLILGSHPQKQHYCLLMDFSDKLFMNFSKAGFGRGFVNPSAMFWVPGM